MLVVLCLNLETILHNNAHKKVDPLLKKAFDFAGHSLNKAAADILHQRCTDCHQSAVQIITELNSNLIAFKFG